MKKTIILLLFAFSSSVLATPELKGHPDELRQFIYPKGKIVSLYAHAEEKAYSDKAIISLVISTDDKTLAQSLAMNNQLRQGISKKLVAAGIGQEHIKSSKFSTSPEYGWFSKKPKSYKVINRMAITITEEAQLQTIAAIADRNENIALSDTAFEHSKKHELEQQVKEKALDNVMQQNDYYEKSLNVTLTPVGFRQSNTGLRATRGAMAVEKAMYSARDKSLRLEDASSSMPQPAPTSNTSFDEVVYQAGMYVDFKIEANAR